MVRHGTPWYTVALGMGGSWAGALWQAKGPSPLGQPQALAAGRRPGSLGLTQPFGPGPKGSALWARLKEPGPLGRAQRARPFGPGPKGLAVWAGLEGF